MLRPRNVAALPAMIGSSLSTIVIFIPFVLMSGVAGAYFSVLTTTMIITLVCSFIVTWIFLPIIYLFVAITCYIVNVRDRSVSIYTSLESRHKLGVSFAKDVFVEWIFERQRTDR